MRAKSLEFPPVNAEAIHQLIDQLGGLIFGDDGELSVLRCGENTAVTKDFLYL